MPVPFPPVGQAKVNPPDAAEARLIAGGVAGAVTPVGGLTSLQRVVIEAVTESMTGFVVRFRCFLAWGQTSSRGR